MCYQLFSLYSKAERTAGSRIIRLNRDIDCANAAESMLEPISNSKNKSKIVKNTDGKYFPLILEFEFNILF